MARKYKLLLLALLIIPCWVVAYRFNVDLVNLHFVAGLVQQHNLEQIYAYNGHLGRYFYGPASLPLIAPLGLLKYSAAKGVWIVLQTISYVLFWFCLSALYPFLRKDNVRWGWLLVWIVAINPIHNNFQSNNIQLMLACLLLLAEILSQKQNPALQTLGGILCSIAASIKVFPLFIAVYYLLVKPKRVRVGVVLGLLFAACLPLIYFGPREGIYLSKAFVQNLGSYHAENSLTKVRDILCLPSLLSRWFHIEGTPLAKGILAGIGSIFLVFAWVRLRGVSSIDDRYQTHMWALALAVMTIINPSTRPHYFIFFVPGFCSMMEILYQEYSKAFLAISSVVAMLLIAFTAEGIMGKARSTQLEFMSVPTVGMIVLCLALFWALRKNRGFFVTT